MNRLKQYIQETLGVEIEPQPIPKKQLGGLPMYIGETYRLYYLELYNQLLVLAEPKQIEGLSILQTEKHFDLLKNVLGNEIIMLLLPQITAFNRKRLIEKGINFIIPDKQLFMPDLLIHLKESFSNNRGKNELQTLLPSAQFLLIYHILHKGKKWKIEKVPFKEIAAITGYSAMAITKAVENLKSHDLVEVNGEKEKFIRFTIADKGELLKTVMNRKLFINPVLKRVFIENRPVVSQLPHTNASALPEYTDLNPTNQEYFAIEKHHYYALLKNHALHDLNDNEGKYCIEVWKYNPNILLDLAKPDALVVDPLSLYLSLQDSHDERVQMALGKLLERVIHG